MRTSRDLPRFVVIVLAASLSSAFWTVDVGAGDFLGDDFLIHSDAAPPDFDHVNPAVAFNPERGEFLVVWQNDRPTYPDIQAQRVSVESGLVGGPFYIAGGPGAQRRNPDVVYNPEQQEFLVVWEELPDGGKSNIHAQRVGATGLLAGGAAILGSGPRQTHRVRPAVAFSSISNVYMVVWQHQLLGSLQHDIEAQVVSDTGDALLGNILIAAGSTILDHTDPDIAYNRSRNEYLIVWTHDDQNVGVKDIAGRLVSHAGVLWGSHFFIGVHLVADVDASVVGVPGAPGTGEYFVVWMKQTDHFGDYGYDFDVYGRSVRWDGLPGPLNLISDLGMDKEDPLVTYDEAEGLFFIAYTTRAEAMLPDRLVRGGRYLAGNSPEHFPWIGAGHSSDPNPALARGPEGIFLTVWNDSGPDWVDEDVFGRLWSSAAVFTDGFESGSMLKWSSHLP